MKSPKIINLNLGCGSNKIEGCINIDVEKSCNPDICVDFVNQKLPFPKQSVSEVYLFHTIEHIRKLHHSRIFDEIYRVLKIGGKLYVSYPEFLKCVQNWKSNHAGNRDFWEKTLYGRQLYPSDYHVCIMDPQELRLVLMASGFLNIQHTPEPKETFNTITVATRSDTKYTSYEELLANDKFVIKKSKKQ